MGSELAEEVVREADPSAALRDDTKGALRDEDKAEVWDDKDGSLRDEDKMFCWVRPWASAWRRTSRVQRTMAAKAGSLAREAAASGSSESWSGRSA